MARLIDAPRSDLDKTVRVFDQFYNFDLLVDANQYDIVYSYFFKLTNSKNIAENFTTIVFRISNITGENVLDLLSYLQGQSQIKANGILTYYLNSLKSKTTLYGVGNIPQPNQQVQRNVVV